MYDILLEFVDIYQFVFLMQEFQKQHFVQEFDHFQLKLFNIGKERRSFFFSKKSTNQDKQNSFHNLKQLFANPMNIIKSSYKLSQVTMESLTMRVKVSVVNILYYFLSRIYAQP